MPDEKPPTPAEQQALSAELRADYRHARLRDQFGEWFERFQPRDPLADPKPPPDRGMER